LIIDYIIINEKFKTTIRDTRVFRGSEIDTDHFLLQRTFKISKQYYSQRRNNKLVDINRTLKTHLLEEEVIQILYGNRLKDTLKRMETDNVEENRLNIKQTSEPINVNNGVTQ
jgi:hypothetical protein